MDCKERVSEGQRGYREYSESSYDVPTAKPTAWKPIVMAVVARKLFDHVIHTHHDTPGQTDQ
jgi:hypothetical protein